MSNCRYEGNKPTLKPWTI